MKFICGQRLLFMSRFGMVLAIMRLARLFLPVSLAFALLFAQQVGAVHTLRHELQDLSQKDKQAPHSDACEKCAAYAQLGSALSVGTYDLALPQVANEVELQFANYFRSVHVLAAVARAPPYSL